MPTVCGGAFGIPVGRVECPDLLRGNRKQSVRRDCTGREACGMSAGRRANKKYCDRVWVSARIAPDYCYVWSNL